ncbi:hypothetical protein PCHAJ_000508800, partial [Plasmodium chabaudi chabaudi]
YASVLRSLWDYDDPQKTNNKFISGNVVRVYCKYAIMFEKQNIDPIYKSLVKKYALGASVKNSSLWDYDDPQKTNNKFISGNVVRVYCKYAIMFEKQNIDPIYKSLVKKYALGASVK